MNEDVKEDIVALLPRLRRFALALTGSQDDGDELVQSACLKAIGALDQFTPGTRLDSWMFRIVRSCWIDGIRMNTRRRHVSDPETLESLSNGGLTVRTAEARLTVARVRTLMAELPTEQREVLALVAIDGLTYREAAAVLELPIGTVMSRLARARTRLMSEMETSE